MHKGKDPYGEQLRRGGLGHDDTAQIIAGTMRPDIKLIPESFAHVADLMQRCWSNDSEGRPTMAASVSVIEGW